MINNVLYFTIASILLATLIAPIVIRFLYENKIIRINSRNITGDSKVGTPIMGGLIFIIPIIVLGWIANYYLTKPTSITDLLRDPLTGSIQLLILTLLISAILGGIDDVLNIYGKERTFRGIKRTLKLIKVHKSIVEKIKMIIALPWTLYKSFFFMLGSHPGKGVQSHEKILVQAFVGFIIVLWIYFYLGINYIYIPILGNVVLGIFMIPFIILTTIVMSNAVNVTDGMDGLSAGLSLISLTGFLIVTVTRIRNEPIAVLCGISIGALIPYLYFNIKPARVQMGDVGSLAIGTLLASIAFSINMPILLIPFCFVFLVELASSFIQSVGRKIWARRIFRMSPLHHHFEILGWNEEKIVIRFWIIGLIGLLIGLIFV